MESGGGALVDNRYSGYINIYISDDEMAADIFLVEAPSPDFYKLEEILEYIQEQGITCLLYTSPSPRDS